MSGSITERYIINEDGSSDLRLEPTHDSTRSLLTPLYASDYESHSRKDTDTLISDISQDRQDHAASDFESPQRCSTPKGIVTIKQKKRMGLSINAQDLKDLKQVSWEDWVIKKTIESLAITKERRMLECLKKEEKKKREEERVEKLKKAELKRVEWLEKKLYEMQKQRKEAAAQEKYKKLKEQQVQELTESRSRQKYNEWYQKKLQEEAQKKMLLKEEEKRRAELMQERKALNNLRYSKWLKESSHRNKTPSRKTTEKHPGSSIASEMFGTSTPSFINPTPWVSPSCTTASETESVPGWEFHSPPLLWEDYERREKIKHDRLKQRQTTNKGRQRPVRHDCLSPRQYGNE